jgi:hypothetical protein
MSDSGRMRAGWVLLNAVGIWAFLHVAAQSWIEPELADAPGASAGAGIAWSVSALPIVVLFGLLHFVAGSIILREAVLTRRWVGAALVLGTGACWVAGFLFDNAHHGI